MKIEKSGEFFKVDAGIAYGWAIVCTDNGANYVDLQGDHIPEDVMVEALADFAKHSRIGKDQHQGEQTGEHLFLYPLTKGSAAGLGITSTKTGAIVGYQPANPLDLEKIRDGSRTGFSIGGVLTESDNVGKAIEKSADGEAAKPHRVFRSFKINEISLVDVPAMEGAVVGYVKSAPRVVAERKAAVPVNPFTVEEFAAASLASLKSTQALLGPQAHFTMTLEDATAEIETLKAKLAKAESMTDSERLAEIEKSDPVAYRGEVSGITVRKSEATDFSMKLAKAHEDQAVAIAKAKAETAKATEIAKAEAASREHVELKKRASEVLKGFPGSDDVHVALLKATESIEDEALRTGAIESLTGARSFVAAATVPPGINPGADPVIENPQVEYDAAVTKAMAEHKVDRYKAAEMVLATKRGVELYAAISKFTKSKK